MRAAADPALGAAQDDGVLWRPREQRRLGQLAWLLELRQRRRAVLMLKRLLGIKRPLPIHAAPQEREGCCSSRRI